MNFSRTNRKKQGATVNHAKGTTWERKQSWKSLETNSSKAYISISKGLVEWWNGSLGARKR